MIYLISILTILLLGLLVNNYLTGRRFLLDLIHYQRIKSFELGLLDKNWKNSKNRSEIVVSFTTIPSRIEHISPTIKSLLYQKRLPKKIILCLPHKSFRDGEAYNIPSWIEELESVQILRVDQDYGPATKFIPTLEKMEGDEAILVLDDDHIYPPGYIQEFEKGNDMYPDFLLTASGWRVPKDLVDKPTSFISNILKTPPTPVKGTRIGKLYQTDIVQGYAGYLIKPQFFDIQKLKNYEGTPEILKYVDDVWISAHSNVPKYVLPLKRYCYSPMSSRKFFRSNSLSMINNRGKERNEDRHNSIAIKYFKDKWEKFEYK